MELLKVELFKIKKQGIFKFAACIPIVALIISIPMHKFIQSKDANMSVWQSMCTSSFIVFFGILLPIFLIYIAIFNGKVESDNNGWKQLLTMPISREKIYITKYIVIMLILAEAFIAYTAEYMIMCYLLGAEGTMPIDILQLILAEFIIALPTLTILYILATKFNSIILTSGVGILLIISSSLIAQSKYWIYAPWTYSLGILGTSKSLEVIIALTISIIMFLVIFIIDMRNFLKRDFL